ncbi:MAG: hypothetical protein A2029_07330 [Chloroflexi bacterium RBG_19FT_COMBO_47_9]|nr:MAG: hypothetical protein A2029_07330 [Chloroflexi bacterium RBG_19FT_COMBO_47_9]
MGNPNKEVKPTRYIIQVKGHLDSHWEHWFEGMKITRTDKGVTIFSGEVIDQSAVHGLFERIYGLNLTLLSVQIIDPHEENLQ